MANANRDQNFVPAMIGVSSVDGVTPTKVYVNPVTKRVLVEATGLNDGSGNVDGGHSNSVYTSIPVINGGNSI
jgi:hypothetical protein